ncbi:uncharacterized protein LOC108739907 isoform X2 [Agrilus planipennis]|nr:uncharacterized protein LOC108739907 isoform X2 [Agrilus planipennis]XP_018329515.1 uncharacterized protein LOC108739907 isoform X2 [Agrilus planipennis]XP_018329516.1 uncharacterized protein LOC108739907 isoform X2 [Agrilus planipennis]XP_018329517.1 uncharacterized protein LOC108739907 isoform X2 [Agrilus planipennis]
MWEKVVPWVVGLLFLIEMHPATSQEDSLRSALKAVNRLQKDLSDNRGYEDYYFTDDYYPTPSERRNLEREIFGQLQNGGDLNNDMQKWGMKKRFSSSFRERILEENNDEDNKKSLSDMFLNQLHSRENLAEDDPDYPELLKEVLDSYGNQENFYRNDRYDKRYFPFDYYPNLGYNNVGMKKRSRPDTYMYVPNYEPREDYDRYVETLEIPSQYLDSQRFKERNNADLVNYQMKKRFKVSKRSSPEKKSTKKDLVKTDAKVEEDLSNIFIKAHKAKLRDSPKKPTKTESSHINPKGDPHVLSSTEKKTNETLKGKHQPDKKLISSLNKETITLDSKQTPLHIEKKSINWSDYFGIDKRKPSSDLDNEWLIERYHKAVAMASKRDPDLSTSKNDEKEAEAVEFLHDDNKQTRSSNINIDKVDTDLKDVEESLIDETLKYTGAHEGVVDSKDVQNVKDKVISQLAAAYNLEKMRQALGEYKNSISKQKFQMKQTDDEKEISGNHQQESEENDERASIKCAEDDEACLEKNTFNQGSSSCSKIQNMCKDQAVDFLGIYNHLLTSSCTYHQTCLLCNENSWFSPTRECNQLFLEKANSVCLGDHICQRVARNSIQHLVNLNKAVVLDSEDCSQYCWEQFTKPHKHAKTT